MVWRVEAAEGAALTLSHRSADGDDGFPGTVETRLTYRLAEEDELRIDWEAVTDAPTVLNLTSHGYWNLAGEGSGDVMAHRIEIAADHVTAIDAGLVPTGEFRAVAGTALDFREPRPIGARIREARDPQIEHARGYDHNYVLRPGPSSEPRLAARIFEPRSGRLMEVLTTEPGLQFYTGNFLDGTAIGKSGCAYRQGDGFCLEAQHFPDSPNRPEFPTTVLRPGEIRRATTIHRFKAQSSE
jgi:aldose 1-epimerase